MRDKLEGKMGMTLEVFAKAFRDRLQRHGSSMFAEQFEAEAGALLRAVNPDAAAELDLAIIELRAPVEHQTLFAGLIFNELPDTDEISALVDRTVASWRLRWLRRD